jgi:hypothetical protein
MIVKIYLRSIVRDKNKYLGLYDSNGNVAINNLSTDVLPGSTIIWKLDCRSGIKSITRIYSEAKEHPIFKSEPEKRLLCKEFKLQVEEGLVLVPEKGLEEKYTIECILYDNTKLIIDPYIRVPPPPSKG